MTERLRGYYAILNVAPADLADLPGLRLRASRLIAGRPCILQLRAKGAAAADVASAAPMLLALCREAGVLFCVNDRVDVALAVGADMVHLGQEDLSLGDARRVIEARAAAPAGRGPLAIGVSTHNLDQAKAAAAEGADYVGVGPIFATASKARPDPTVGIETLARICASVYVPVVAIGGIDGVSASAVARAGAAAAAVISAVEKAPDPTAAALTIREAFTP